MYRLIRISLHQWYVLDAIDVDIDKNAAIIGPTGAGKSSLLDAIQTALSGNNQNVLELNGAAGERRDRTVRDYALGCVSDVDSGLPSRDRAESTIVLTFRDDLTNRYIAIGVLLWAERDQAVETRRLVADGLDFRISDFIETLADGGEVVATHDEMIARLQNKLGPKKFILAPNSKRFVGEYLQLMRPRQPAEPTRFLRAFGNALNAKEIKDPTHFVRSFVLDPLPLDVKGVRTSIQTWRSLVEEVRRIETMLSELSVITKRYRTGFEKRIEAETDRFLGHYLSGLEHAGKAVFHDSQMAAAQAEAETASKLVDNHKKAIEEIDEELRSIDKAMLESHSAVALAEINAKEVANGEKRITIGNAIKGGLKPFLKASFLRAIEHMLPMSVHPALAASDTLDQLAKGRTAAELVEQSEDIVRLCRETQRLSGARDSLEQRNSALVGDIRDLETETKLLEEQLSGAKESGNLLSRSTLRFMQILADNGIHAVPLPEVVDVTDESWAFALESLLGPNREALIVDEEDLDAAFVELHRHRDELTNCRLVNTRKISTGDTRPVSDSIGEIAKTDNPVARAFIDFNVGRFVRVENVQNLDRHANAIMRDGRTNAGMSKRVFRNQATILGKVARQRALENAQARRDECVAQIEAKRRDLRFLASAFADLTNLDSIDIRGLETQFADLMDVEREIRSLKRQKATVETNDDRERAERKTALLEECREYKREKEEGEKHSEAARIRVGISKDRGDRARENAGHEQDLADKIKVSQQSEDAVTLIDALQAHDKSIAAAQARIEAAIAEVGVDHEAIIAADMNDLRDRVARRQKDNEQKPDMLLSRANRSMFEFSQKWGVTPPLDGDNHDPRPYFWAVGKVDALENNELRSHKDRLEEARTEMETTLKEGLLNKLRYNFEMLDQKLRSINDRLNKHSFVGQKYLFQKRVKASMKAVHDLARKVGGDEGLSLIAYATRTEDGDAITAHGFAELERMLSDDDATLKEFEDYRNYFDFELYIDGGEKDDKGAAKLIPFSSVVGKLSGGQRQAPYYVAIAASMVSAYFPSSRGADDTHGMGVVVFDEAFNKLDIDNTRKLIKLYEELGLQVIVAAPEEKRGSLVGCVNSIVNVSRRPGSRDVFIDTAVIGQAAHQAMLRENPEFKTVDAFRSQLGNASAAE